jgi:putative oxidoreductase
MKRVLQLQFVPTSADLALLLLRLWFGGSLLILHGWGKLMGFSGMASSFPDPLGVGARNSLILAIIGEVVCPALLILGLFTRIAALGMAITMGVAFWAVHGLALSGPQSGELAYVYLGVAIALLIAGAGRFSLDGRGGVKVSKA